MPLHIPIVVLKRFWIPAVRWFDAQTGFQVGPPVLHAGHYAAIFFRLPPNYTSMTSMEVSMKPWATQNWNLEVVARAASIGEHWWTHNETKTITPAAVDDEMLSIDLVTILTTIIPQLMAGDLLQVVIENNKTNWITCFGADVIYS